MRLLLILPLAAVLAIGCSRQDTSGQKGAPLGEERQGGAQQGLEGTWKIVSMFMGGSGKTVPPERVADLKVSISGQQWTMTKGGKVIEHATMTADPSKQPKAIDLAFTQGESAGQTVPCIYEVTGDMLRIAWSEPGKARPTDFANRAGLRQDVWELRRE
jgi:uncharacterized protein (TIGR03067 family)